MSQRRQEDGCLSFPSLLVLSFESLFLVFISASLHFVEEFWVVKGCIFSGGGIACWVGKL